MPGAYIINGYKSSSDELTNKFRVNLVDFFAKQDENLNFDLFKPNSGSKRGRQYDPGDP